MRPDGNPKTWSDIVWVLLPNERQVVSGTTFAFATFLVLLGYWNIALWNNEFYKLILQAVVVTGIVNMVLAYHFAAKHSDEAKDANTSKALDLASKADPTLKPDLELKPGETVTVAGDDTKGAGD